MEIIRSSSWFSTERLTVGSFVLYGCGWNLQLILRSSLRLLVLLSLSNLSRMSRRRNEPTIERVVEAAPSMPPSIELAPLLFEILTGFVSAQMFTANLNSATSASHGVTCEEKKKKRKRRLVNSLFGNFEWNLDRKGSNVLRLLSYSDGLLRNCPN